MIVAKINLICKCKDDLTDSNSFLFIKILFLLEIQLIPRDITKCSYYSSMWTIINVIIYLDWM